jgi:carbamoylphosphate synthase large subunit
MTTILVTGAGGPMGCNVTRSLRAAPEGYRLIGTDANRWHLPLGLTDDIYLIPPAKQLDDYLAAIDRIVADEGVDLIFPTHPVEVRTISAHRDRFGVATLLPSHDAIRAGQDKYASYCKWREVGLPVPETFLLESPEDVTRAFDALKTRPVWVRGAGVPGRGIGVASLPCRTVAGAVAWVEYWNGWGGMAASQYLPGDNLTWLGVWCDGDLVASQARRRLEYVIPHVSPSGVTGAPAVSQTHQRDDINEIAEQAVRVIDPRPNGSYFVDLTCDEQDRPHMTEVNVGRFGTTIHFYTEAGFNFPRLYVQLALGQRPELERVRDVIPVGRTWVRTLDCGPELVTEPGRFDVEMGQKWR